MGKLIAKKISGINIWAKVALVALCTLLASVFMYDGLFKPTKISATPTISNAWTNVYAATASTAAVNVNSSSFAVTAGSNRLLLVAVQFEISTGNATLSSPTVTYGGVALTPIQTTGATSNRSHAWMGYLNESQIPAGSNVVNVQATASANTISGVQIAVASYTDVDQTTPINDSSQSSVASATITFGAQVDYVYDGLTVYCVNNGGTAATMTPPTGFTTQAGASSTGGGFTGFVAASGAHATAGNYPASTTFTFGGTTSTRSAIVVASLRPAAVSAGSIQLAAPTYSVNENGTSVTITATRTGGSTGAVGISYATTNITATAGSDYTAASGTLSWADGDTANKTFTVNITDDGVFEGNESFIAAVTSPTGGALLGTPSSATVTINDNEGQPTVQWSAASQSSVNESGTMTVTAQLSNATTSSVTVPYTLSGTATSGTDYTITASPITINAGSTTGSATITITGDTTVEPNETVILTIGTPTNATLGATAVHTATITNDDSAAVNSTAAGTATAVAATSSSITVTAPYTNDSNGNNTLKVEWGTGGTYTLGNQTLPHAASPYIFNISGLTASTAYNVRVTYQDADTVTGTAVQTFTPTTPAYSSPLMHTAANVNPGDTKGYGTTWGSTFTCETCHAQGTTNVKLIATSVATPNGARNVVFTRMTASLNSQNGVFGNDQRTYAGNGTGGSSNICEVCHRKTSFHRYSTNAPTLTHYNNQLCITCHTHALGFKPSGGHVVPMFATTDGHTGCASGIGCHSNSNPTAPYPTAGTAPDCRACHTKADPTVATNGCGSCHGAANGNGEPVGTVYPDVAGSHAAHTALPTACTSCHDTGGTGGNADHGKGNRGANPAVVNLAASFGWNGTSCSTASCHANVYGSGSVASPAWGTAAGCTACHSVAIGASGPATGSHNIHTGTACTSCHAAGTSQTSSPSTGHADGDIDVINGYPVTAKHAAGTYTGTCSTSVCHGTTSPTWGANTANATCTKCHGTPSTTDSNANRAPNVGAHQAHVRGAGSFSYSRELTCYECHNSGTTISFTNHMNGNTQNVVFTNASTARDNGMTAAAWTAGTYPNGTCSVYCHGQAMPNGDTSGTARTPSWTASLMTGAGANDCSLCHGNPPTAGTSAGTHTSYVSQPTTSCTTCHTHFNAAGGFDSEASRRLHVDGILQVKNDCDTCHDYDTVGATYGGGVWSGGSWGKAAKSVPNAYGAHAKHINYIKTRLGYAVALNAVSQTYGAAGSDGVKVCGTCHSVAPAAHTTDNSSARSIFPTGHPYLMGGTGGTSLLFGSSNPTYTAANKTCSNISCHYFTTPTW